MIARGNLDPGCYPARMSAVPRVSILLPFRNAAPTLNAAIESIAAQTFKDWECLLINDGSEDGGGAVAERWRRSDARFRRIEIHTSMGIAIALETDPHAGAIGCLARVPEPTTDGMRRYLRWLAACADPVTARREIWVESPIIHPTAIIRSAALARVGGYRDLGWPEDYDLWLRLHRAGYTVRAIPESLYEWRDRSDRLSRVDARYSTSAFLRCRVHHLRRWLSEAGQAERPLVIWGAGRDGKRFARAWEEERERSGPDVQPVEAFVDIDPRKIGRSRRDRRILSWDEASRIDPRPFVLAAVGIEGARDRIRPVLQASGFDEERDFLCVH